MDICYKKQFFNRVPSIDVIIQENIKKSIFDLTQELKREETNIISNENKNYIKEKIILYESNIYRMFNKGFSELEFEIDRMNLQKVENGYNAYDEMILEIMRDIINKGLFELEDQQIRDREFLVQCVDRRIFINKLLENGLLNDKRVIKIINGQENEQEYQQDIR